MTQNNSNELNQFTGPNIAKMLDAGERVVARLDAELKDAKTKLDAHESLWKTSQKVITDLTVELIKVKEQRDLYKQELEDASAQAIQSLELMQKTKHSLETVMEQFFKYENK